MMMVDRLTLTMFIESRLTRLPFDELLEETSN